MIEFYISGGPMNYILSFTGLIIVILTVKIIFMLFKTSSEELLNLEVKINSIIFWGVISAVLGFYAHFYGLYLALRVISKAQEISPSVIAGGYAASLTTVIFGLFLFLISLVFWFVLKWRYNKIAFGS
ncbi:MotA/TolQ/ExbB proton channel family protein [candidate division KSB1 bacterium]